MKQALQIGLKQGLVMTSRLQQAIKLLQLPSMDLQQEVQKMLDSNPMLDAEEGLGPTVTDNESEWIRPIAPKVDENSEDTVLPDKYETALTDQENYVDTKAHPTFQHSIEDANQDVWETKLVIPPVTLQQHIRWQVDLIKFSKADRIIATNIIDAITPQGFLGADIASIQDNVTKELPTVEIDEINAVLHLIQKLDPLGVGSRDVAEYLTLQLNELDPATPGIKLAKDIVQNNLNLLGRRDYMRLKRMYHIKDIVLNQALSLIQSLQPKPGICFTESRTTYTVPDVIVHKDNHRWKVSLNSDLIPKLNINKYYSNMLNQKHCSETTHYLKHNLQEAHWFIKSLKSRNQTILRVAEAIVEHQYDFFEHGERAMKPMILKDIAKVVDMHESTISRATNQKYMLTDKGTFELKRFFSSHVTSSDGGEHSATAIRAAIKKLITEENTHKPLSDSKITEALKKLGIDVARRTVAKYREGMQIPPSNERKHFAQKIITQP